MAASVAGAYVRKAAYRHTKSDFSPLSIGGRKKREADVQPQCAESVNTELTAMTERHCNPDNHWRTASYATKWKVRTYESQTVVVQEAARLRSMSAKGRVMKPRRCQEAQSR